LPNFMGQTSRSSLKLRWTLKFGSTLSSSLKNSFSCKSTMDNDNNVNVVEDKDDLVAF
jgi:hypothetical protein